MGKEKFGLFMMAAALAFNLSSCMEKDVFQGTKDDDKEFNDFDYTTVQNNVNLEVSYVNSDVEANVYFEVYDAMPVTAGEYNYVKKDDVMPLFAAYTGDNSIYKGMIELPAYVKKVYIYTPAFFAQTLIEAEVVNGSIKATDYTDNATTRTYPTGTTKYYSYMLTTEKTPTEYSDPRWKEWLGTNQSTQNGEINYKYTGKMAAKSEDKLYEAHTTVINIDNKKCPEEYRSYSDMYISKKAEVAVTFLGQNTCWNSSLGYYYYKEGEKPASLDDAHIIMLFPNTQDGKWSYIPDIAKSSAGIDRLTAVQLKYYPNIANGSTEDGTNTFPAGYRIGFVLATNAWSNRVGGYTGNKMYRAATSEGLSRNNNGVAYPGPRTAVYKYGDWVMISFEDHVDDENFSDVVITLKSNPVDAIIDIPEVDPDDNKTTTNILKGIYTFEDMWPSKGDYDMNDVVVRYNYGKTFDIKSNIYAETFTFKVFANIATNNNGLAFKLNTKGAVESATYSIRKAGAKDFTGATLQYEAADNVYILTDNVKNNMEGEYKITVNYSSPITEQSSVQPFIFKNEKDNKRWEVHIPKEKPTSKVIESYFGMQDDASKPEQGIYYVRKGAFPFAIYLSGANEQDLSKLLLRENESKAIDLLYDGYKGWVESDGKSNQDWYKK